MKASIRNSGDRHVRSALLDRFDNMLDLSFEGVNLGCVRIRNEVAHHRDTLDQFRYALNKQKREADQHKGLGRPLRQAAGISRLLVDRDRTIKEWNTGD